MPSRRLRLMLFMMMMMMMGSSRIVQVAAQVCTVADTATCAAQNRICQVPTDEDGTTAAVDGGEGATTANGENSFECTACVDGYIELPRFQDGQCINIDDLDLDFLLPTLIMMVGRMYM